MPKDPMSQKTASSYAPDKSTILENVRYKLVCRSRNAEMLKGMPHKDFLDLSAVYRIPMARTPDSEFSLVIQHNSMCTEHGITFKELDAAAYRNTKKEWFKTHALNAFPSSTGTTVLYEVLGGRMVYGSNALLYPKSLDKAAGMLQDDLYVLAFSIHQLIAGPVSGSDPHMLALAAQAIGSAGMPPEYFLSGSVYRYDRSSGSLEIAVPSAGRM